EAKIRSFLDCSIELLQFVRESTDLERVSGEICAGLDEGLMRVVVLVRDEREDVSKRRLGFTEFGTPRFRRAVRSGQLPDADSKARGLKCGILERLEKFRWIAATFARGEEERVLERGRFLQIDLVRAEQISDSIDVGTELIRIRNGCRQCSANE